MNERPILFSTPMVQAILNGTKTQTRRVVKPMKGRQSEWLTIDTLCESPSCYLAEVEGDNGAQFQHPKAGQTYAGVFVDKMSPLGWVKCPYGQIGDVLWVRETFAEVGCIGWPIDKFEYNYKADYSGGKWEGSADMCFEKWKPSLFMPREACRIRLKINDIRVERLQQISEGDAENEGVLSVFGLYRDYINNNNTACDTARDSFRTLWQSINGHDSWNQNPWVWVINFERI